MGFYHDGRRCSMSTPVEVLRFPGLRIDDKARLAAFVLACGRISDHEALDEQPIEAWARKLSGNRLWERLWAPLLDSKFDGRYDDLPATYLWSRMRRTAGTRSKGGREVMGAIEGGYQALVDRLAERIRGSAARVHTRTPIRHIPASASGRALGVVTEEGLREHDTVVTTQLRPNLQRHARAGARARARRRPAALHGHRLPRRAREEERQPVLRDQHHRPPRADHERRRDHARRRPRVRSRGT